MRISSAFHVGSASVTEVSCPFPHQPILLPSELQCSHEAVVMFLCLFMWQRAGFLHLCISLVLFCILTARGGIFPLVVTSDPQGHFVKASQFTSPRRDRLTLAQRRNYPSWDAIRQGTLSLSQLCHANRRCFFSLPPCWPALPMQPLP